MKDRRTPEQIEAGLATPILWWYDEEVRPGKRPRRRVNGIAITKVASLVVARATCSYKDQFVKAIGRRIVEGRILKGSCDVWYLQDSEDWATAAAEAYRFLGEFEGDDEIGIGRAFNVGRLYAKFLGENPPPTSHERESWFQKLAAKASRLIK